MCEHWYVLVYLLTLAHTRTTWQVRETAIYDRTCDHLVVKSSGTTQVLKKPDKVGLYPFQSSMNII
jgi:hypothetical protein